MKNIDLENTKNRFQILEVAQKYNFRFQNTKRDLREKKAIALSLEGLKKGAKILDIPCGTGRISFFLKELGFQVIGADSSTGMIENARKNGDAIAKNPSILFEYQDISKMKYSDASFDALVCNRLFHHYNSSKTRIEVLKEMARVSKGPIVLSFFWNLSFSALIFHCKNFLLRKKPIDRVPIFLKTLKQDLTQCDLEVEKIFFTRFGISPQTYLKIRKIKES